MALLLVLVAAVIHATWNLITKRAGGDVRYVVLLNIVALVIWAPVGLWFARREVPSFGLEQWALVTASGFLHIAYFLALLRGYNRGDLSVVYPLARGTGPVITAVLASVWLNEALGWQGTFGVAAVAVGIVIITGGRDAWRRLRSGASNPEASARLRQGVGYGLLTGAFIAAYSVVDGYAVKEAGISPVSVDYLGQVVRLPLSLLLLAFLSAKDGVSLRRYWSERFRPALIVAFLSPVAYVLVLYAVQLAPLSHVAPAREVSTLFAALLGGKLLREGNVVQRVVGALCITLGIVALALS
ncbi:MAG TPA: DMT family transporter [Polyangiaceae bacterium]|nr:DMT family transporter [Polyangiaceae bacterium]